MMRDVMKQVYLLFIISAFTACGILSEPDKKPQPGPDGIVLGAKAYTYKELPGTVKTDARDLTDLKKENGYYVQLIFDNHQLANASTEDTNYLRLINTNNYYELYGTRNSPTFFNEKGDEVVGFGHSGGHHLIHIARDGNLDTSYYGPLLERPVKMQMNCTYLDSAHTPRMKVN